MKSMKSIDDIMIDLIEDIKPYIDSNITYLFVDTGLEYAATKEHIEELQCKYKCKIETIKPEKTIPNVTQNTVYKEQGVPVALLANITKKN